MKSQEAGANPVALSYRWIMSESIDVTVHLTFSSIPALAGKHVITDDPELVGILKRAEQNPDIAARLSERYGTFLRAVSACDGDLKQRGHTGTLVIHRNHRVQVWPEPRVDARPSYVRKLVPIDGKAGELMVVIE